MKEALDAALQAKADFGISIGTLVLSIVLWGLGKYKDFIGRGCPGQRGTRLASIYPETHACVHEEKLRNLFESSVKEYMRICQIGTMVP